MKGCLYLLCCFCCLGSLYGQGPKNILAVGTHEIYISSGTEFHADGLSLQPTTALTLSNTNIILDYSATNLLTGSISRTYSFSNSINSYSGTIKINYLDTEVPSGVVEGNLNLYFFDTSYWNNLVSLSNNTLNNTISSLFTGGILSEINAATPSNTPPTDIVLSALSINENLAIGSLLGGFTTTDINSGDSHSYTLTDTANYPDNSSFAISGANLQTAVVFDYETKITYNILVETSDGTDTYTKTFTISITDVDEDSDGDGIPNSSDNCPSVANASQADADGDGVGDACDNAPNTPNTDQKDTDGDGLGDVIDPDDDNDGCPDTSDDFPLDAAECSDTDGDSIGDNADADDDNDGVLDTLDNCPSTANADQLDTDGDGLGDVCDPDDDGDGFSDEVEITCGSDPIDPTSKPVDTDSDSIPDCIDTDDDNDGFNDNNDAFPLVKDEWVDTDGDGLGNNADIDDDNDGQSDAEETFCDTDPLDSNSFSGDVDEDGITDCRDTDNDNDGVNDSNDAFPLDPSEWTDTDADGIGNNADTDDDGDGFSDLDELECNTDPLDQTVFPGDLDGDGIADCKDSDIDGDGCINTQDVFPTNSNECFDTDGDGLGDNFEVDDDNDGYLDANDAFPLDPNEWADADNDGIGDNADLDDNNDGFEDEKLFVSGVLTPNSSGLESTWKITNIERYPNARIRVYNKNGQEVFSAINYRNDWRGTHKTNGSPLPASSYYYIIAPNNGGDSFDGWLFITY